MTKKKVEQYSDMFARLYPEVVGVSDRGKLIGAKEITFQLTDDCNLNCTYCYQINKGKRRMPFEVAKKVIDDLLADKSEYFNRDIAPAIILSFIGGEPFLEIDLIDQIVDYFKMRTFELMHPWAEKYMISFATNGTLYFKPSVQKFLHKNKNRLSISVTIDGNKELHDKCRVFPDGSGSYDLAYAAAQDWMSKGGRMGSKITICPENLPYLNEAIDHFISTGYNQIFANTVFEEGWTPKHATQFYWQLKALADRLLERGLYKSVYISLFDENGFQPMNPDNNRNWCGGTGAMLAVDPAGFYYPCIRYMESSLGDSQPPLRIGHINTGIACTEADKDTVRCLDCITRRSQSTDECFDCPIAQGCAWCSAYNYQVHGTPNKRATFICEMHKARSLANAYYWNKVYRLEGTGKRLIVHCPEEWANQLIGEKEYDMLINLASL